MVLLLVGPFFFHPIQHVQFHKIHIFLVPHWFCFFFTIVLLQTELFFWQHDVLPLGMENCRLACILITGCVNPMTITASG